MNKYVAGNPVEHLLDDSDAIIRYLTLRDVIGESSAPLQKTYNEMADDKRCRELLSNIKNHILGDVNDLINFHRGSAFLIAKALNFGFDGRESFISKTIHVILERWQHPGGGICGPWQPPYPDAALTGEIIALALKADIFNDRVQKGIDWILARQRHDGGWLYAPISGIASALTFIFFIKSRDPLRHDGNPSIPSCMIATTACMKALLACRGKVRRETIDHAISRGARYMLTHHLRIIKTVPTLFNYHLTADSSAKVGNPLIFSYDILLGLLIIAASNLFNVPETSDAFNVLIAKQSDAGILPYENFSKGMLFQSAKELRRIVHPEKWPTLNFLRLLKLAGLLTA